MAQPFPPPLLEAGHYENNFFFAASLSQLGNLLFYLTRSRKWALKFPVSHRVHYSVYKLEGI